VAFGQLTASRPYAGSLVLPGARCVRAHAIVAPMCAPCKRAAQPAALSRTDPAVIRQT